MFETQISGGPVGKFFVVAVSLLAALAVPDTAQAQAQTREITGTVNAQNTSQPLADATVTILGQPVGARTNAAGQYRLRVPASDVTILVRSIGFKRQSRAVPAATSTADFVLEKDVLQLEQVVVTGQSTTLERRNATTAISQVSAEEVTRAPGSSIESALQGKIIGASINMNTGQPGGGGQIQIRGASSIIGQSDPLYVVDGVIIANNSNSSGLNGITQAGGGIGGTQDAVVNRLADLNPNEIESLEVLKSAAATAIYGSRASNGVVVIKTKRGREGATRVNLTQRVGTQKPLRLVGQRRFTSLDQALDYSRNRGDDTLFVKQLFASGVPEFNDFGKQLYDNTDPSYETILNVSGGSASTQYLVSGTQKVEQGIARNTDARLQSARVNVDQQFGDKLRGSVGLNFTRNFLRRGVSNNDNIGISPTYVFGYTPSYFRLDQKNADGTWVVNPFNGGGPNTTNPFQTFDILRSEEDVYRQFGNLNLTYAALSTSNNIVNINLIAGVDRFQQDGFQYSPAILQYEGNDGLLGTAIQANVNARNLNSSLNAVWTFTSGGSFLSSVTTSAGLVQEEQSQNVYRNRGRGTLPGVPNFPSGSVQNAEQTRFLFRDQAMYVNEEVRMLNERLTLSGGVRADRSSANGDVEEWFLFPRASGSYNFETPISSVDNVKLRASYGQTGNRPRYGDRDILLNAGSVVDGRASLIAAPVVGNNQITPEKLNEIEFGTDMSFLNQRVSAEATYYSRKITDQLLAPTVALSSGLTNLIVNAGELSNKGYEFGLNVIPVQTASFTWTSRATYQSNKQEVKNLPRFVVPFAVPGSFGANYGRNFITTGARTTAIWGNARVELDAPGGRPIRIIGVNEVLDNRPANTVVRDTIIGDANPDFQMFFTNQLTYNRFGLSFLFDWRKGGDVANMTNNLYDEGQNSRDYDAPSPIAGMTLGQWRYDTFGAGDIRPYIQNGGFVKLREVAVTYDLPTGLAKSLSSRLSTIRLQLQGRNLATWTKYWGADPEFNNFGNTNLNRFIDLAPYPPSRQFFFSVDLGF